MRRTASLFCLLLLPSAYAYAEAFGFVFASQASLTGEIRKLTFFPDGDRLVALTGSEAAIYGLRSDGQLVPLGSVTLAEGELTGAAVSPDGRQIALAADNGDLSIYESSSLRRIAIARRAHKGRILAATFTHDGSYVVTGGVDARVRVWTPRGDFFAELSRGARHQGEIVLVSPVPPGRRVLSVGRDRQVIAWDVDTQQALRPTGVDKSVISAAADHGGRFLALGLQTLTGNRSRSAAVDSLVHTIRADDRIRLIDLSTGLKIRDLAGPRQDLTAVDVTPDGHFVAAGGSGRSVGIWDTATGDLITSISFEQPVTALGFAPSGQWLLACTGGGKLSLYRLSGVGSAPPEVQPQILILIFDPVDVTADPAAGPRQVTPVVTSSLRVRGRIKSPSGVKSLLVNGRPITSLLKDESGDYLFNAYVPLPTPGTHEVEILAENVQGGIARKQFQVHRSQAAAPTLPSTGRRLALIVGISRYADSSIDLAYANADARALYNLLTNQALGPAAFRKEDVQLLLDDDATVANVNTGLREFLKRARENDFVLFFFAGHGAPDPNRLSDLYLLAHDTSPSNIAGTGPLMRHVREAIAEIPARDVLILTDACHSAGMAAPANIRNLSVNPIHQVFLDKMIHTSGGLAILTASEAAQVSFENSRWDEHGVFTYYLLKGLQGASDGNGDRIVTLGELMEYVREQVRNATGQKQIPAIGPTSFDRELPLSVVDRP